MNDDLHPDALDDELRRRFASGSPVGSDPDVVLDALRPQLVRARTRRRASFASAIAGVAVIVVVLAFVLGGGDGGGSGSVHTPPASRGPVNTVPPAPTPSGIGGSASTDTLPDGASEEAAGVTTPSIPDATPPTEPASATTSGSQLVPAGQEAGFNSAGGSIVVRLADGDVSLVSSSPAAGFLAEVHDNGPTRVEVRFNNGQTEWRIRVDVVNGQLVDEITQH